MMLIPNLSRLEGKYINANSKPILHIISISLLFCASIDKLNKVVINNIDWRYLPKSYYPLLFNFVSSLSPDRHESIVR